MRLGTGGEVVQPPLQCQSLFPTLLYKIVEPLAHIYVCILLYSQACFVKIALEGRAVQMLKFCRLKDT